MSNPQRLVWVVALGLAVTSVGHAAAPPRDRTAPSTPRVDSNRAPADLRPAFHFSAKDDRTPPLRLRFRCAIDNNTLRPCARIHRPAAPLAFGRHVIRVRAVDRAGNASRVATWNFQIIGTWDAATDFARAPGRENPGRDVYGNVVWFYSHSGTAAHNPDDYRLLPTFSDLEGNFRIWHSAPAPFAYTGVWLGWSFGWITMHPGHPNLGQNAILGWRSPVTSSVTLVATIWHNQSTCSVPQNGVLWSVDQGASTLESGRLAPGERVTVERTTVITAGEPLFVVVDGGGDTHCDGTFVAFRITTR